MSDPTAWNCPSPTSLIMNCISLPTAPEEGLPSFNYGVRSTMAPAGRSTKCPGGRMTCITSRWGNMGPVHSDVLSTEAYPGAACDTARSHYKRNKPPSYGPCPQLFISVPRLVCCQLVKSRSNLRVILAPAASSSSRPFNRVYSSTVLTRGRRIDSYILSRAGISCLDVPRGSNVAIPTASSIAIAPPWPMTI